MTECSDEYKIRTSSNSQEDKNVEVEIWKNQFKQQLKNVIKECSLHANNWKNEKWLHLIPDITQIILDDAFAQHDKLNNIFGIFEPRRCKQITRIVQKTGEISARGGEYFKVLSDFVAGRIHCNVNEIPFILDKITQIVDSHNGVYYIKGSTTDQPYGGCQKDGKYTDITQYIYVYIEEIGYIVEFQVGHEFAALTFSIDSELRDNKNSDVVDLWTDDFYNKVKTYLLLQANMKDDIYNTAKKIHTGNVPTNLNLLLQKMF